MFLAKTFSADLGRLNVMLNEPTKSKSAATLLSPEIQKIIGRFLCHQVGFRPNKQGGLDCHNY